MKHLAPICLLSAMWIAVLLIFFTPTGPHSHGYPHDHIKAMDQGGAGAERHTQLLLPGWFLGATIIAIFVSLLTWATVRSLINDGSGKTLTSLGSLVGAFLVGGILFETVFTLMFLAYRDSLEVPKNPVFIGSFPAATWWLLFGVWMLPAYFILLYVVFFNSWFLPPETMTRFRKLLVANKSAAPTSNSQGQLD